MKNILLALFFLLFTTPTLFSQIVVASDPCGGTPPSPPGPDDRVLSVGRPARQSSNYSINSGQAGLVVDGNKGNNPNISDDKSKTSREQQPWVEVDLGGSKTLKAVQVYFSSEDLPQGLNGYYIIFSDHLIPDVDLSTILASNTIQYIYVDGTTSSGQAIPVGGKHARYLRLQFEGLGTASFYEIEAIGEPGSGTTENCFNGIDDNGDCKADCEDTWCAPTIWQVRKTNPTCPVCNDGKVEISVSSLGNLPVLYSIDGGVTFNSCPSVNDNWCVFDGLPDGDYPVVVTNTICTTFWRNNPIVLKSPVGSPNNCCNNGDFENGDFSKWSGGVGTNDDNGLTFTNSEIDGENHVIITSGYEDPFIPNLPVPNGGTGTYLARLGDLKTVRKAARLEYCFEVTECNKNFLFNYLLVLEDPGHNESEQPFFQYKIKRENGEVIKEMKRVADSDDPFFTEYDGNVGTKFAYTFWKCENVDLHEYIDEKLCIEFVVADCTEGGHRGYAYIDGLCNSSIDNTPTPILKGFNETYCQNQKISIDGTESYGFNQFGWKVCEIQGTQEVNCVEAPLSPGGQIGIFDLETFYNSSGNILKCGKSYKITLTLSNDCTDPVIATKNIEILCEDGVVLSYKDIINCYGESADVKIEGDIFNCAPCNIAWTPSSYLSQPNIPNPTIEGSNNVLALSQVYNIKAIDQRGCIAEDDVFIYNVMIQPSASISLSYCDISLKISIVFVGNDLWDKILIDLVNTTTNEVFSVPISTAELKDNTWTYVRTFPRNSFSHGNYQAYIRFSDEYNVNCPSYTVEMGNIQTTLLYYGGFNFAMPNAFTPDGDGLNDVFMLVSLCPPNYPELPNVPLPQGFDCDEYGHNAYRGKMEIWNRWGEKIFEKEVFGTPEVPFNRKDLAWDGTNNGSPAPIDTYIYRLELENCSFVPKIDCETDFCYPSPCECTNWTGEVTVIR